MRVSFGISSVSQACLCFYRGRNQGVLPHITPSIHFLRVSHGGKGEDMEGWFGMMGELEQGFQSVHHTFNATTGYTATCRKE